MQRQPFASIEADDEIPFLPANLISVHFEARTIRLRNFQWLDVGSLIRNSIGRVISWLGRQCPDSVLFDSNHSHGVQIDNGPQSFDRASITIVSWICPEKTERSGEPP